MLIRSTGAGYVFLLVCRSSTYREQCFYINLPIGAITLFVMVFLFKSPHQDKGEVLSFKRRLEQFDPIGSVRDLSYGIGSNLIPEPDHYYSGRRMPAFGATVGWLHLSLEERTRHCAVCCFRRAHHHVYRGADLEAGQGHCASAHLETTQVQLSLTLLLFAYARTQHLGWRVVCFLPRSHLLPIRVLCKLSSFHEQITFLTILQVPIWFQAIKGVSAIKSGVDNVGHTSYHKHHINVFPATHDPSSCHCDDR